jgi:esterase
MQLHFREKGGGEPLVMLHGLFGSSDNWMGVAPRLAEQFHVLAPDLRNHGRSPHSSEMNYPLMANDVAEFLDARGLSEVFLVGHSMGGKTAMQFALQHPQCVRKLIVVDMAPRTYKPVHEPILAALLALDLSSFQTLKQIEDALAPSIPGLALRRFLLKNIGRNPDGTLFWKINLRGVADNYSRLNEPISAEKPFGKPTLFLRGGNSNHVTKADEPLIQQLFPQVEIQTIEGASHWVHADAPEEFVQRVTNFIQSAGL